MRKSAAVPSYTCSQKRIINKFFDFYEWAQKGLSTLTNQSLLTSDQVFLFGGGRGGKGGGEGKRKRRQSEEVGTRK